MDTSTGQPLRRKGRQEPGTPLSGTSRNGRQCDEWRRVSTDLALQASGLSNIVSIDEGSAATELDLVGGRRRWGLERVSVVVMGASVFCGDGRVVEGIGSSGCDRYVGLWSASAGVLEHLDVAARCAVVGGVVGVVALQLLRGKL
jgi:hypothetical protein